jgi:cobalt-zinc-cadmium efflux system membrane fusion protein
VKISVGIVNQQIDGVIAGIGPGVDATTRRMPIYIALKSIPARLAPGMQVEIELQETDAVLSLPATAVLIKDGHRRVVYVEKAPGKFEPREVRTGRASDGRIQVHEGLKPGDRVVVKGALLLDGEADQAL